MYFHSVFCNNNNISTFLIFFSHDWVNLFGLSLYTCKSHCIIWQQLHSNWNVLFSDPAAFPLCLVLRLRSNKDDTWEICIHSENMWTFLHPQNICFALWPEVLDYFANMSWCESEFWLISLSKISDHSVKFPSLLCLLHLSSSLLCCFSFCCAFLYLCTLIFPAEQIRIESW